MTYQPRDVWHWTFDEKTYSALSNTVSFPDDFSTTNKEPDADPIEYSSSKFDELFDTNICNNSQDSCATPTLAPSYQGDEQSMFDCQFDESELLDPSKTLDPINEITITTTPDTENDPNNNIDTTASSELQMTVDDFENIFRQTFDQLNLQKIDQSIQQRNMSIATQPPTNLRPRYKSDGTRQIEKSRTNPMVVELPNSRDIQLESGQAFLLRLSLIKHELNSSAQKYLHVNKLEYHSLNVQKLNDDTICIPLTADHINEGRIALPRLSIVKTKLDAYKPELTPYCLTEDIANNQDETVTVKEAKAFFENHNLKASRIACQLLIKQNESIHFTDITCETHSMIQKDQKNATNKRSANVDDDERPSTSKSRPLKRKKTF